jgi:hypothetical protein
MSDNHDPPDRDILAEEIVALANHLFWANHEPRLLDAIRLSDELANKLTEYQALARQEAFESGLGRIPRGEGNGSR